MFKFPVIDSHIHMYSEIDLAALENAAKQGGYWRYTLLSGSFMPQTAAGNLSVMWAKEKNSGIAYGYAGIHMPEAGEPDKQDLLNQVKQYHKIGFDGIKMIDGKPSIRKKHVALDHECYDPMFTYLEENQIPVLYHSNDPAEFWDMERIPGWAKNIYYYDGTNPSKDQITRETVGILKKHPGLNLTIAHFFFLPNTEEYELACQLMEAYPHFFMDFTPGWEMFQDFQRNSAIWKEYIIKYSDRLVYGTDMSGSSNIERLEPLRKALETEDVFKYDEYTCYGLNLDDNSLKNIYSETYSGRIQRMPPRKMDMERGIFYAREVRERILSYRGIDRKKALEDMERYLELCRSVFHGLGEDADKY